MQSNRKVIALHRGKRHSIENASEVTQIWIYQMKTSTISNTFKELKKSMRIVSHQIENNNKRSKSKKNRNPEINRHNKRGSTADAK